VESVIPLQFLVPEPGKCYGILNCEVSCLTSGRVICIVFERRDVDARNTSINHGPELEPALEAMGGVVGNTATRTTIASLQTISTGLW
jgi:hypothetical protein